MNSEIRAAVTTLYEVTSTLDTLAGSLDALVTGNTLWDEDIEHEMYKHPNPTAPVAWAVRGW